MSEHNKSAEPPPEAEQFLHIRVRKGSTPEHISKVITDALTTKHLIPIPTFNDRLMKDPPPFERKAAVDDVSRAAKADVAEATGIGKLGNDKGILILIQQEGY